MGQKCLRNGAKGLEIDKEELKYYAARSTTTLTEIPVYCTRPGMLDRFIRRLRYLHLQSGRSIADYACAHGCISTASAKLWYSEYCS